MSDDVKVGKVDAPRDVVSQQGPLPTKDEKSPRRFYNIRTQQHIIVALERENAALREAIRQALALHVARVRPNPNDFEMSVTDILERAVSAFPQPDGK